MLAANGMTAAFWATLGFMAGIAAAFFVVRLWRGAPAAALTATNSPGFRINRWMVSAVVVAFLAIALILYGWVGRPGLPAQAGVNMQAAAPHAMDSNTAPGSMADATNQLAAKLAAGNGSDADWQLLQQSYEFLGDADAAQLAGQHRLKSSAVISSPGSTSGNASSTAMGSVPAALESYQKTVARNPDDAAAWRAIAQLQRTARHFPEASAAFTRLIKLKAMDADSWADYADVTASLRGSLTSPEIVRAIDAALKLDDRHTKALWLKASLAHEQRRYADAVPVWRKLRAVIPDNSPDVAIVEANIAEASQLAGAVSSAGKPAAAAAQVQGRVMLDAALQQQVSSDMTLFIYAKAKDSPAPVAAYRGQAGPWPVSFVLDDDHAMMPARKLSQYQQVSVEARLSHSGQALAQSGDLQADAVLVDVRAGQPVTLRISRRVP